MSYRTKIEILAQYARAGIAANAMARARRSAGNACGARIYTLDAYLIADAAQDHAASMVRRGRNGL